MKPTVSEEGVVVRLDGDKAVVKIEGGESCKGCGAGKIGLCRSGYGSMIVQARNGVGAQKGDVVILSLDRRVKAKGYSLAYIVPLVFFIAGALAGSVLGEHLSFPNLDVLAGFAALAVSSLFSFRGLRRLDCSSLMAIKRVVSDKIFSAEMKSDEELKYEQYALRH